MIHKLVLKLLHAEIRRRHEKFCRDYDARLNGGVVAASTLTAKDAVRRSRSWDRAPDQRIGPDNDPYNDRWFIVPKNRWFGVYLHHFQRSDDDRALHDHPWLFNISWLLDGDYDEITFWRKESPKLHRTVGWQDEHPESDRPYEDFGHVKPLGHPITRKEGTLTFRWGASPHRVLLHDRFMKGSYKRRISGGKRAVWTLFIVGPKVREWGFYCTKFWRHWKVFASADGMRGRGCG